MKKLHTLFSACVLFAGLNVSAQVIDISTGVDQYGNLISCNSYDDDWYVSIPCSPSPCTPPLSYVNVLVGNGLLEYYYGSPPYYINLVGYPIDPAAGWLCPHLNPTCGSQPVGPYGDYYYRINFNVNSCNITNAVINLNSIGGDDYVDQIIVNGNIHTVSYGHPSYPTAPSPNFLNITSDVIPMSNNVLEVRVPNNNTHHGFTLRGNVTITGTSADPSFVMAFSGSMLVVTPANSGNHNWQVWGSPNGNPGSWVNVGAYSTTGTTPLTLPAMFTCYYVTDSFDSGCGQTTCAAQSICKSKCSAPDGGNPNNQRTMGEATGILNLNPSKLQSGSSINIFPNPAKGSVSFDVQLPSNTEFSLLVTDITGRVVKSFDNVKPVDNKASIKWSTDAMAKGSYLVKLQTADQQVITKKLIIE